MSEIQQDPNAVTSRPRSRRRWVYVAVPLAVGAVAITAFSGGLFDQNSNPGPGTDSPVAAGSSTGAAQVTPAAVLLNRIATVAESKAAPTVRDDQYVYVASTAAWSRQSEEDPVMRLQKPRQLQIWLSVDGSRPGLARERGKDQKLAPRSSASLNLPTYRYLESLPTDPDALLKKIYHDTKGAGEGPDQEAFVTIGDMLRDRLAPPKISAAFSTAAAKIPDTTVVDDAVDAAGRHGVAVAQTNGGERTEWIFDKVTLDFLGERGVMVKDTPWGKAGQVTASTAVTNRGIVDKPGVVPGRAG